MIEEFESSLWASWTIFTKQSFQSMFLEQLRPEPVPEGMTSREIVRRAIEFEDPPRIPYSFQLHPNRSDIMLFGIGDLSLSLGATEAEIGSTYVDRWGVTWEVSGRAWDHAIGHPLPSPSIEQRDMSLM